LTEVDTLFALSPATYTAKFREFVPWVDPSWPNFQDAYFSASEEIIMDKRAYFKTVRENGLQKIVALINDSRETICTTYGISELDLARVAGINQWEIRVYCRKMGYTITREGASRVIRASAALTRECFAV
jgi:hypothetical protein